jgi:hypothetical protein
MVSFSDLLIVQQNIAQSGGKLSVIVVTFLTSLFRQKAF